MDIRIKIHSISKSKNVIVSGFIAVLLIFCVFLIVWFNTTRQEHNRLLIIDQYRHAAEYLGDMRQAALQRSVLLHEMTLGRDIFDRIDKQQEFSEEAGHFILARDKFLSLKLLKENKELWNEIVEKVNHNALEQRHVAQLILDGKIKIARQIMHETSMPQQRSVMLLLSRLLDQHDHIAADELSLAAEAKVHNDLIIAGLAFIAILVTVCIIFFVLRTTTRIQNDLRKADEARVANEMKSKFLSTMSHELRTPLNAILGFGQLLELQNGEVSNDITQQHISEIIRGGHQLLALINELLDLSRIETGNLDIKEEPIPLKKVVTECISQIDTALASKCNVTVINHIDDPDLAILADSHRIRQVFINLLSNAVKYNHEGGSVTIESEPTGKDWLRILVSDTGAGIAASDMVKLFDPFERLSFKHGAIEGTGIGLTVTKQLVEAMDGSIGVESKVGQGSTFWLKFPLATIESRAMDSESKSLTATQTSPLLNKPKVLYIEDNPVNARLVEVALNQMGGFDFFTSPSAEDGLIIAEEEVPDIILMDISLPGIDGFTALKILRDVEVTRNITVIAVTANAMESDIKAGRDAGFDDYLTKPINIKQLYAIIEKHITGSTSS